MVIVSKYNIFENKRKSYFYKNKNVFVYMFFYVKKL